MSKAGIQTERPLLEEIRKLMDDSRRLIEDENVSLNEVQRIVRQIVEIRLLLGEWAILETVVDPARPIAEETRVLKEQFLELEGQVKEVRNGLERKRRTHCIRRWS